MGLIISRFRRKKTTEEVLETLETNIRSIEKEGQCKEEAHKRIIGYMMAYSVGIYVLFALLYYFMYAGRGNHWLHSLVYASPLLVLPIVVIFLRSGISWYYNRTLAKTRIKLNKMKEEKKKILEEVMNTETYKVAKVILDKYGENQSKSIQPFVPTKDVPGNGGTTPPATPGQLRQRQIAAMMTSTPIANNSLVPRNNVNTPGLYMGPRLTSDQLPRPLLDKNRSAMDKVVDYLLKDGPNHRMALICVECCSHNGMAMEEEFEYVSYKCAYCGRYNAARKQRPSAPQLSSPMSPPADTPARNRVLAVEPRQLANAGDDSSVASSNSDSEDEKRNASKVSCGDADRPPSPETVALKSDTDKKED